MIEIHEPKLDIERAGIKLYRIGGILFILIAIGWFAVTRLSSILYSSGQPNDALGYLQLFSQKQVIAASDWSIWIICDILLIPASLAVYFALRRVNKNLVLAGTALALLFCVYDIFGTELISLRLVSLSQGYVVALSDAVKAPIIANAASIVSALHIMTFFSFIIGSVGMLLWSIVMLKSIFTRGIAIFGIVVNFLAVVGSLYPIIPSPPPFLGVIFIFCVPLVAFWLILVGVRMLRNSRRLMVAKGYSSVDPV